MSHSAIESYLTEKLGYSRVGAREFLRNGRGKLRVVILDQSMKVLRDDLQVYYGDIPRNTHFLQVLLAHV